MVDVYETSTSGIRIRVRLVALACCIQNPRYTMDDEAETYKLWRIRKTVMQVSEVQWRIVGKMRTIVKNRVVRFVYNVLPVYKWRIRLYIISLSRIYSS